MASFNEFFSSFFFLSDLISDFTHSCVQLVGVLQTVTLLYCKARHVSSQIQDLLCI